MLSAYSHREESRKYLRFVHEEVVYQFRTLPFGLSDSPYVFTRVVKVILQTAQSNGIQISGYLDNWLNRSFNYRPSGLQPPWAGTVMFKTGVSGEPGEVRTGSYPKTDLHRLTMGSGKGKDVSYSGTCSRGHNISLSNVDIQFSAHSSVLAEAVGVDVGHQESNSVV
jgi:hypothetical protein